MLITSSSAAYSPGSTVGGLMLSTITGDEKIGKEIDESKGFMLLLTWSVVMVILQAILATIGLYSIIV